jgi:serine-type D-Ala-D-Ala endopeptidase (penicillin-binding protein 7)
MKKLVILLSLMMAVSVADAKSYRKHYAAKSSQTVVRTQPSYALYNLDDGIPLALSAHDPTRPIASVTKLMTALVVVRDGYNLDELVPVSAGSSLNIRGGMQLTRRELVYLSLVSSDNLASVTLAQTSPIGYDEFIRRMNATAAELGLKHTHFIDASGLSMNVSNTLEISKLVATTLDYPIFADAANMSRYNVTTVINSRPVFIDASATNTFVGRLSLLSAKTGYTRAAGNCVTLALDHVGTRYILVVLGANNPQHRQQIAMTLIERINKNTIEPLGVLND